MFIFQRFSLLSFFTTLFFYFVIQFSMFLSSLQIDRRDVFVLFHVPFFTTFLLYFFLLLLKYLLSFPPQIDGQEISCHPVLVPRAPPPRRRSPLPMRRPARPWRPSPPPRCVVLYFFFKYVCYKLETIPSPSVCSRFFLHFYGI